MDKLCGECLGAVLVNPIVELVDVDGVVRRIDINDVVKRIDIDALVSRIDVNKLLRRIEWDEQLQRIDFDAVLERIDINQSVLQRSDVGAILSQSTTGIVTNCMDFIRIRMIIPADLTLYHMIRLHCLRASQRAGVLPPMPSSSFARTHSNNSSSNSRDSSRDNSYYPRDKFQKAMAVQGRYTGFIPKVVAMFIDIAFLALTFALACIFLKLFWILFLNETNQSAKQMVDRGNWFIVALYCLYWFLYFFGCTATAGVTIGMYIAGTMVVDIRTGKSESLTTTQALVRTCLLPVTATVFPPLAAFGLVRRDGRMFHDVVANTGIVYCFDAQFALMRHQSAVRLRRQQMNAYHSRQQHEQERQQREQHEHHQSTTNSNTNNNYVDASSTEPLLSTYQRESHVSSSLSEEEEGRQQQQETAAVYSTFS